jgi:hypothetical protein
VKILLVLALATLALWFIGSRMVDRGQDMSAVAESTETRLNDVANVLRQATANAQGTGSTAADTAWANQANGVCSRQSDAVARLGTPTTVSDIAAYLRKALPIVRRHHAQLGTLPPPDALAGQARLAGRTLLKQEALLADVHTAARRGNTSATLDRIERLRSLARAANPNLIGLGLTDCALSSPGLPL